MSFATQVAIDLGRSALVAGIALAVGWRIGRCAPRQWWFWPLVLAPLLTPALLISYAWARTAQALGAWPWLLYVFHGAMLTLKLVPLAALVRHYFPPPLTSEGEFCYHLAGSRTGWEQFRFMIRSAGRTPWLVGALLFLLAFPEFELASLWSLKTWPVSLFDAHVGGLALMESLRMAAFPTLVQIAIVAIVAWLVSCGGGAPMHARASSGSSCLILYAGLAAGVVTAWPLLFVGIQAAAGIRTLSANTVFPVDVAASLAFATAAALIVWLFTGMILRKPFLLCAAALPGLLGSLIVALFVVAIFQIPAFRAVYDTPLPLLTALVVILLPAAAVLHVFVGSRKCGESLHVARLAGSRSVTWELHTKHRVAAIALLGCLAWFDFTASSILAPVGLTPVFVRLHNLAHYGQTAALSAMLFVAVFVPVAVLALTLGAGRLYARRDAR